uniref:Interferon-induced protein with tetratricopeptide repeats 12 n=1 Tax=Sinocyclocheilus rhinocerous TaxID=307959 RepID=A0A673KLE2_9TELE
MSLKSTRCDFLKMKLDQLEWRKGLHEHNALWDVKFLLGHEDEALKHLLRSEKLIKESLSENCDKTLIVTCGNLAWINYHMKNYTDCENDDVLRVLLGLKLSCSKMLKNESEKLVETALNVSPEHPHVMRYVGIFFRDQRSVDSAIEMLNKASEISPNSCFIHHQLAMCYKTKKINLKRENRNKTEIDEARDKSIYHLEMATSQKASFIFAMSELALQYGERNDLQMDEELFDTTFKTATEMNEHLQVVHLNYTLFQQYCNRCEDLAIEHYKKCLTMGPHTKAGTTSAWKLKKIADGRIKYKPDD